MTDDPARAQGVQRIRGAVRSDEEDLLAVEEPLSVRVDGARWLTTLRTPGDDLDLVWGLLWSDGVLTRLDDADAVSTSPNLVDVRAAPGRTLSVSAAARATTVSTACGLCGRLTIDELCAGVDLRGDGVTISAELLQTLPDTLRSSQGLFSQTGGVHAAGLFNRDGALLVAREDVGRHNAVDKVVGAMIRRARASGASGLALAGTVLVVTGRAGFEIVQKAARAGVPVVCAVSAPTTMSAALAVRAGVTLAAFVRGAGMNLYAHPHRVR